LIENKEQVELHLGTRNYYLFITFGIHIAFPNVFIVFSLINKYFHLIELIPLTATTTTNHYHLLFIQGKSSFIYFPFAV